MILLTTVFLFLFFVVVFVCFLLLLGCFFCFCFFCFLFVFSVVFFFFFCFVLLLLLVGFLWGFFFFGGGGGVVIRLHSRFGFISSAEDLGAFYPQPFQCSRDKEEKPWGNAAFINATQVRQMHLKPMLGERIYLFLQPMFSYSRGQSRPGKGNLVSYQRGSRITEFLIHCVVGNTKRARGRAKWFASLKWAFLYPSFF